MKKDITYDELLAKIPNKYILTIVGGERARERAKERMERGGEPLPLTKYDKKDTEMKKVFKEILAGKVSYEDEEEIDSFYFFTFKYVFNFL